MRWPSWRRRAAPAESIEVPAALAAEADASPLTKARVRDLANQADERLNRATVLLLRDQQLEREQHK